MSVKILNIAGITAIKEEYEKKAEKENYEYVDTVLIYLAANKVLVYSKLAGQIVDGMACGEFTRRVKDAIDELEDLLKSIGDTRRTIYITNPVEPQ